MYNGNMRFFWSFFILVFLLFPVSVAAQENTRQLRIQLGGPDLSSSGGPPGNMGGTGEQAYVPPRDPVFDKVVYLKIEPPRNLDERIERLLYGIRTDIPPAYDHYGYEIRRYMAGIAGPKILGSPENIAAQISNIDNAKIVARYWRDALFSEIHEIEKQIDAEDASSATRSIFKFNRGVVQAFFAELESWLNNNRAALDVLLRIGPDRYAYVDPVLSFKYHEDLSYFSSLHKARESALKQIRAYTPFRMMIY